MVASGLVDRPSVSHYRLAAHLLLAVVLYAYTVWLVLELGSAPRYGATIRKIRRARRPGLIAFLFVVMTFGALMAGLRAGTAHNTFPTMSGYWIPPGLFDLSPWWINPFENGTTIQFIHRWLAKLLVLGVLVAGDPRTRRPETLAAGAMALLQLGLGIATILSGVDIVLADAAPGRRGAAADDAARRAASRENFSSRPLSAIMRRMTGKPAWRFLRPALLVGLPLVAVAVTATVMLSAYVAGAAAAPWTSPPMPPPAARHRPRRRRPRPTPRSGSAAARRPRHRPASPRHRHRRPTSAKPTNTAEWMAMPIDDLRAARPWRRRPRDGGTGTPAGVRHRRAAGFAVRRRLAAARGRSRLAGRGLQRRRDVRARLRRRARFDQGRRMVPEGCRRQRRGGQAQPRLAAARRQGRAARRQEGGRAAALGGAAGHGGVDVHARRHLRARRRGLQGRRPGAGLVRHHRRVRAPGNQAAGDAAGEDARNRGSRRCSAS